MHCVGCYLSYVRHVRPRVMIRNVLSPGVGNVISWQPPPEQFRLIFDDVTWIYHKKIRHVYKVYCFPPPPNKNHNKKHYHLYTIKCLLEFSTMWMTPQPPWADQCTVKGTTGYALWTLCSYFLCLKVIKS